MAKRVVMGENGEVKSVHSDHGDIPLKDHHEGHSMAKHTTSEAFMGHHHPNPILGGPGATDVFAGEKEGELEEKYEQD